MLYNVYHIFFAFTSFSAIPEAYHSCTNGNSYVCLFGWLFIASPVADPEIWKRGARSRKGAPPEMATTTKNHVF
jgi:hypothetical protein